MKITFLGTGAADWVLALHKDMEGFRRNASALIDDVLLIDPGPDVMNALEAFNKDASKIKYIINTHRHSDHYNEETIKSLTGAEFVDFKDGDEKKLSNYTVKAFKSNHPTCNDPVHFIISDGEKNVFYGLDGAWLTYKEVAAIKENNIDYAILDATVGDIKGDFRIFEHNNLNMVKEMTYTLNPDVKQFCISHMARTLHNSHEELVKNMQEFGVEVAYDGMERII